MVEEQAPVFYTLQQVALRLQLSEKTIHRLLQSQQISAKFISRRWRFTEEDVMRYVDSCKKAEGKGARKKRAYTRRTPS